MSGTPTFGSSLIRAAELARAGGLASALDELQGWSTFEVRAAYAQAIRRRSERQEYVAASELLESALLIRQRGVIRGARWYDRPELLYPGWFGLLALMWATRLVQLGWRQASGIILIASGPILVVLWSASRRRRTGQLSIAPITGQNRTDLERTSRVVEAVLELAEADDAATARTFLEVAQRTRGVGADLVAAAALARAERTLRNSFNPAHRRASNAVAEARVQSVEQRLDEEILSRLH